MTADFGRKPTPAWRAVQPNNALHLRTTPAIIHASAKRTRRTLVAG